MRGGGRVVVWHQVAVVRHKVASEFVKVLNRHRQEELDSTEDVQQRLRAADRKREGSASAGAAGVEGAETGEGGGGDWPLT